MADLVTICRRTILLKEEMTPFGSGSVFASDIVAIDVSCDSLEFRVPSQLNEKNGDTNGYLASPRRAF